MVCTNRFVVVIIGSIFVSSVQSFQYKWSSEDIHVEKWFKNADETIQNRLNHKQINKVAKNLILFLGDGMGITTITAGRIRKGQLNNRSGEEEITFMESLPNVALSKTYNIDLQTPDSAGTATAFLCGIKTRHSIIGLNGYALQKNCKLSLDTKQDSIVDWAHKAGKSVGIVTTTRITHATPAAAYAHVPFRDWESYDDKYFGEKQHKEGCSDIAAQLIENNTFINVLFGGGRVKFLPKTIRDPGRPDSVGDRTDGRNLINEWISKMEKENKTYKYVWNASDFRSLDVNKYDHVLSLLSYDHMEYELLRNKEKEPSILEMAEKAIEILSRNENGYFLLVEGGRIDHGHHGSQAKKAIEDFVAFDNAIGMALKKTKEDETLVLVTADHSHTFSIGGYSPRGNELFGVNINKFYDSNVSSHNVTYTSLLYGNGPGGLNAIRISNLTNEITTANNYTQESAVLLKSETHGGEDVAIYARGPMSHLFSGTVEQSYIPHAMAYASCIGRFTDDKKCRDGRNSSPSIASFNTNLLCLLALLTIYKTKVLYEL